LKPDLLRNQPPRLLYFYLLPDFFNRVAAFQGQGRRCTIDITGRNELKVPTPSLASDPAWSPLLS
jgi:hypothetical protein